MFRGIYGGSQKHADDLHLVLNRAWNQGVKKMIITVGTLNEADAALELAKDEGKVVCKHIQCVTNT